MVALKGQTMKSGESTRRKLERVNEAMGFPTTDKVNKNTWADYRAGRYAAGIKAKTLNREQETLSSLFGTLIETGNFHHENPFKGSHHLKYTRMKWVIC
jgi:site-specific recombinase XerD